jgi:2-methylcitrate dehydratase PrpD
MNALDDLAAFVSAGEAAAGALQAKLRLHVVDTLAAWVSGLAIAEGRALVRFHNSLPAASAFDDVALACAASRLSEVDDIHLASMTTCGSIVIPAALTLAVALKASPDDLAPAILGGYEAMIRLGLTIEGPDVLYRGIWPTYFGAPFGAAAVAARLLELDAKQTGHALAFALTLAAPSVGQHHAATTSRWLSVGQAARHGIAAAYAARDGFTSDTNVLHSRLLPDVFGIEPDLPQMAGGSSPYFMDVSLKPWCAARQTMPATQALRELLDGGVAVSEITEIEAYVLPPHLKMIDHGVRAGDRASHLTSLPYQMAVAALAPRSDLDVAQAPAAVSAELQGFMARITVAADNALLADYPKVWPGRIVVTTSSGRHERSTRAVPGDSAHPFTDAEVGAKFQRLVAPVAGETRARRLFDLGSSVLQHETALSTIVTEVKDLGGDGTEVRR